MTYRVEVSDSAQRDIDSAYQWLTERTTRASRWLTGLEAAIDGLAQFPQMHGLARENASFDEPVRQLLYGRSPHVYRVLFVVRDNIVYVTHVRHGARNAIE